MLLLHIRTDTQHCHGDFHTDCRHSTADSEPGHGYITRGSVLQMGFGGRPHLASFLLTLSVVPAIPAPVNIYALRLVTLPSLSALTLYTQMTTTDVMTRFWRFYRIRKFKLCTYMYMYTRLISGNYTSLDLCVIDFRRCVLVHG